MSKEEVLTFSFQSIPLTEVPKLLVPNYKSTYSPLHDQILKRIESNNGHEASLFQINGKSALPQSRINGVCTSANDMLKKKQMSWRVRYSRVAKAFVLAPTKRKDLKRGPRKVDAAETQAAAQKLSTLLKATTESFGVTLEDLRGRYPQPPLGDIRRAFYYVGRRNMGLRPGDILRLLRNTSSAGTRIYQEAMKSPQGKKYVRILSKAVSSTSKENGK